MHETGANIGFIISKFGLQAGAKRYTVNTNVTGLTYQEFQERYFPTWWKRYFCPRIGDAADRVLKYTEPFNTVRDRAYATLSATDQDRFDRLRTNDGGTIMILSMFNYPTLSTKLDTGILLEVPTSLETFKSERLSIIAPHIRWECATFRELLESILQYLADVEAEFNQMFGSYIFDIQPASGVDHDGPPLIDL